MVWVEKAYDLLSSSGIPHSPVVAYGLHTGKQWTVLPNRYTDIEVVGISDNGQVVVREVIPAKMSADVYTVPLGGE